MLEYELWLLNQPNQVANFINKNSLTSRFPQYVIPRFYSSSQGMVLTFNSVQERNTFLNTFDIPLPPNNDARILLTSAQLEYYSALTNFLYDYLTWTGNHKVGDLVDNLETHTNQLSSAYRWDLAVRLGAHQKIAENSINYDFVIAKESFNTRLGKMAKFYSIDQQLNVEQYFEYTHLLSLLSQQKFNTLWITLHRLGLNNSKTTTSMQSVLDTLSSDGSLQLEVYLRFFRFLLVPNVRLYLAKKIKDCFLSSGDKPFMIFCPGNNNFFDLSFKTREDAQKFIDSAKIPEFFKQEMKKMQIIEQKGYFIIPFNFYQMYRMLFYVELQTDSNTVTQDAPLLTNFLLNKVCKWQSEATKAQVPSAPATTLMVVKPAATFSLAAGRCTSELNLIVDYLNDILKLNNTFPADIPENRKNNYAWKTLGNTIYFDSPHESRYINLGASLKQDLTPAQRLAEFKKANYTPDPSEISFSLDNGQSITLPQGSNWPNTFSLKIADISLKISGYDHVRTGKRYEIEPEGDVYKQLLEKAKNHFSTKAIRTTQLPAYKINIATQLKLQVQEYLNAKGHTVDPKDIIVTPTADSYVVTLKDIPNEVGQTLKYFSQTYPLIAHLKNIETFCDEIVNNNNVPSEKYNQLYSLLLALISTATNDSQNQTPLATKIRSEFNSVKISDQWQDLVNDTKNHQDKVNIVNAIKLAINLCMEKLADGKIPGNVMAANTAMNEYVNIQAILTGSTSSAPSASAAGIVTTPAHASFSFQLEARDDIPNRFCRRLANATIDINRESRKATHASASNTDTQDPLLTHRTFTKGDIENSDGDDVFNVNNLQQKLKDYTDNQYSGLRTHYLIKKLSKHFAQNVRLINGYPYIVRPNINSGKVEVAAILTGAYSFKDVTTTNSLTQSTIVENKIAYIDGKRVIIASAEDVADITLTFSSGNLINDIMAKVNSYKASQTEVNQLEASLHKDGEGLHSASGRELEFASLKYFIDAKKGDCRHLSLMTAFLLSKAQQEGKLNDLKINDIYIYRSQGYDQNNAKAHSVVIVKTYNATWLVDSTFNKAFNLSENSQKNEAIRFYANNQLGGFLTEILGGKKAAMQMLNEQAAQAAKLVNVGDDLDQKIIDKIDAENQEALKTKNQNQLVVPNAEDCISFELIKDPVRVVADITDSQTNTKKEVRTAKIFERESANSCRQTDGSWKDPYTRQVFAPGTWRIEADLTAKNAIEKIKQDIINEKVDEITADLAKQKFKAVMAAPVAFGGDEDKSIGQQVVEIMSAANVITTDKTATQEIILTLQLPKKLAVGEAIIINSNGKLWFVAKIGENSYRTVLLQKGTSLSDEQFKKNIEATINLYAAQQLVKKILTTDEFNSKALSASASGDISFSETILSSEEVANLERFKLELPDYKNSSFWEKFDKASQISDFTHDDRSSVLNLKMPGNLFSWGITSDNDNTIFAHSNAATDLSQYGFENSTREKRCNDINAFKAHLIKVIKESKLDPNSFVFNTEFLKKNGYAVPQPNNPAAAKPLVTPKVEEKIIAQPGPGVMKQKISQEKINEIANIIRQQLNGKSLNQIFVANTNWNNPSELNDALPPHLRASCANWNSVMIINNNNDFFVVARKDGKFEVQNLPLINGFPQEEQWITTIATFIAQHSQQSPPLELAFLPDAVNTNNHPGVDPNLINSIKSKVNNNFNALIEALSINQNSSELNNLAAGQWCIIYDANSIRFVRKDFGNPIALDISINEGLRIDTIDNFINVVNQLQQTYGPLVVDSQKVSLYLNSAPQPSATIPQSLPVVQEQPIPAPAVTQVTQCNLQSIKYISFPNLEVVAATEVTCVNMANEEKINYVITELHNSNIILNDHCIIVKITGARKSQYCFVLNTGQGYIAGFIENNQTLSDALNNVCGQQGITIDSTYTFNLITRSQLPQPQLPTAPVSSPLPVIGRGLGALNNAFNIELESQQGDKFDATAEKARADQEDTAPTFTNEDNEFQQDLNYVRKFSDLVKSSQGLAALIKGQWCVYHDSETKMIEVYKATDNQSAGEHTCNHVQKIYEQPFNANNNEQQNIATLKQILQDLPKKLQQSGSGQEINHNSFVFGGSFLNSAEFNRENSFLNAMIGNKATHINNILIAPNTTLNFGEWGVVLYNNQYYIIRNNGAGSYESIAMLDESNNPFTINEAADIKKWLILNYRKYHLDGNKLVTNLLLQPINNFIISDYRLLQPGQLGIFFDTDDNNYYVIKNHESNFTSQKIACNLQNPSILLHLQPGLSAALMAMTAFQYKFVTNKDFQLSRTPSQLEQSVVQNSTEVLSVWEKLFIDNNANSSYTHEKIIFNQSDFEKLHLQQNQWLIVNKGNNNFTLYVKGQNGDGFVDFTAPDFPSLKKTIVKLKQHYRLSESNFITPAKYKYNYSIISVLGGMRLSNPIFISFPPSVERNSYLLQVQERLLPTECCLIKNNDSQYALVTRFGYSQINLTFNNLEELNFWITEQLAYIHAPLAGTTNPINYFTTVEEIATREILSKKVTQLSNGSTKISQIAGPLFNNPNEVLSYLQPGEWCILGGDSDNYLVYFNNNGALEFIIDSDPQKKFSSVSDPQLQNFDPDLRYIYKRIAEAAVQNNRDINNFVTGETITTRIITQAYPNNAVDVTSYFSQVPQNKIDEFLSRLYYLIQQKLITSHKNSFCLLYNSRTNSGILITANARQFYDNFNTLNTQALIRNKLLEANYFPQFTGALSQQEINNIAQDPLQMVSPPAASIMVSAPVSNAAPSGYDIYTQQTQNIKSFMVAHSIQSIESFKAPNRRQLINVVFTFENATNLEKFMNNTGLQASTSGNSQGNCIVTGNTVKIIKQRVPNIPFNGNSISFDEFLQFAQNNAAQVSQQMGQYNAPSAATSSQLPVHTVAISAVINSSVEDNSAIYTFMQSNDINTISSGQNATGRKTQYIALTFPNQQAVLTFVSTYNLGEPCILDESGAVIHRGNYIQKGGTLEFTFANFNRFIINTTQINAEILWNKTLNGKTLELPSSAPVADIGLSSVVDAAISAQTQINMNEKKFKRYYKVSSITAAQNEKKRPYIGLKFVNDTAKSDFISHFNLQPTTYNSDFTVSRYGDFIEVNGELQFIKNNFDTKIASSIIGTSNRFESNFTFDNLYRKYSAGSTDNLPVQFLSPGSNYLPVSPTSSFNSNPSLGAAAASSRQAFTPDGRVNDGSDFRLILNLGSFKTYFGVETILASTFTDRVILTFYSEQKKNEFISKLNLPATVSNGFSNGKTINFTQQNFNDAINNRRLAVNSHFTFATLVAEGKKTNEELDSLTMPMPLAQSDSNINKRITTSAVPTGPADNSTQPAVVPQPQSIPVDSSTPTTSAVQQPAPVDRSTLTTSTVQQPAPVDSSTPTTSTSAISSPFTNSTQPVVVKPAADAPVFRSTLTTSAVPQSIPVDSSTPTTSAVQQPAPVDSSTPTTSAVSVNPTSLTSAVLSGGNTNNMKYELPEDSKEYSAGTVLGDKAKAKAKRRDTSVFTSSSATAKFKVAEQPTIVQQPVPVVSSTPTTSTVSPNPTSVTSAVLSGGNTNNMKYELPENPEEYSAGTGLEDRKGKGKEKGKRKGRDTAVLTSPSPSAPQFKLAEHPTIKMISLVSVHNQIKVKFEFDNTAAAQASDLAKNFGKTQINGKFLLVSRDDYINNFQGRNGEAIVNLLKLQPVLEHRSNLWGNKNQRKTNKQNELTNVFDNINAPKANVTQILRDAADSVIINQTTIRATSKSRKAVEKTIQLFVDTNRPNNTAQPFSLANNPQIKMVKYIDGQNPSVKFEFDNPLQAQAFASSYEKIHDGSSKYVIFNQQEYARLLGTNDVKNAMDTLHNMQPVLAHRAKLWSSYNKKDNSLEKQKATKLTQIVDNIINASRNNNVTSSASSSTSSNDAIKDILENAKDDETITNAMFTSRSKKAVLATRVNFFGKEAKPKKSDRTAAQQHSSSGRQQKKNK